MATNGQKTAFTYMNVGRSGMNARHNVYKVHDIPPAAYFAADKPFTQGDVCAFGLWDEAADEPVAYPFIAGTNSGYCYIPNFNEPFATLPNAVTPFPVVSDGSDLESVVKAGERSGETPQPPCSIGCKWSD